MPKINVSSMTLTPTPLPQGEGLKALMMPYSPSPRLGEQAGG